MTDVACDAAEFDAWVRDELRARRVGARRLGAGRRARRPGRGDALRRARRRQAPAAAAGAALPARRCGGDARGRAARRGGGGTDPRLLAGARRHALHGQRRAAPRQADRARAFGEAQAHAGRRRDAGAGLRGADARRGRRARRRCRRGCARLLARAAGHAGMAGGQAIDLASIGKPLDEAALRDMHRRKTGALLQASVLMGAACGACEPARLGRAGRLRRCARPGLPGGRRHPRRDPGLRTRWARPPARTCDDNKPTYVVGAGPGRGAPPGRRRCATRRQAALARSGLADTAHAAPAGRHGGRPRQAERHEPHEPYPCSKPSTARPTLRAPVARPSCKQLADELRDFVLQSVSADRRPPVVQPGHGRADDRAALRVRHARTTASSGTWATRPIRTRS